MRPRAGKVGNTFFVIWAAVCLAALGAGGYALHAGLEFREQYQEAEGEVFLQPDPLPDGTIPRKGSQFPYVRFRAGDETVVIPAPRSGSRKELDRFKNGKRVAVWYRRDDPHAAQFQGDRGLLVGGVAFTAAGAVFTLAGLLAAVAEFLPNRFVRFADR